MAETANIILEGSYLYFKKGENYAEESFKLVHFPQMQTYHFYAEILSRIQTGELFKVLVRYEMNNLFYPYLSRIEKSIGNKYSLEVFNVEQTSYTLNYSFKTSQIEQDFRKDLGPNKFITSPAVCTSAVFTLVKKFNASERSPVILVSSENDWTYRGPPEDKIIFAEFKSSDSKKFELNGNQLNASHLFLHEVDSNQFDPIPPVEIFLSKHFSVPYQVNAGDQKFEIKNLRKLDN